MITPRRRLVTFVLMGLGLVCVLAPDTSSQSLSSLDLPWAGWAQCEITIQAPGYSHREAHRWTITAGVSSRHGSLETYPGTWTVTGHGSLQRKGDTTVSTQWRVDGTVPNLEIGITRHVDRITVQRWTGHGPARGALTGLETVDGTTRSRSIALDVQQWSFPLVEGATTSTRITGSSTAPFDGARGPMAPGADRPQGSATCSWDFTRGGPAGVTAVVPPSQPNTATLNDPARSRAARTTSSSERASSPGGTSASTPTQTTTILPSVLAVEPASAAPAEGASMATTNTPVPADRPQLHATILEPPTNVTVRCQIVGGHPWSPTRRCDVNWTRVQGASGYIVTHRVSVCRQPSSNGFCLTWGHDDYPHNVGAESASWSAELSGNSMGYFVTAVYPGDARSGAVQARSIP